MATTPVAVTRLNAHTRATFLSRASDGKTAVKENALTTRIIDAILPYFPLRCRVIGGYLDNRDQYWKINYHWDYLVDRIDQFLALKSTPENLRAPARAIRAVLMSNPPNPARGYRKDPQVGMTKDQSPPELVVRRHALVKQSKKDFETILVKAGVLDPAKKANPPAADKPWWLAVAPVAPPGDSKHGTGYALDIAGDNAETTRIANALGATLVFNEASHVHVEWKDEGKLP